MEISGGMWKEAAHLAKNSEQSRISGLWERIMGVMVTEVGKGIENVKGLSKKTAAKGDGEESRAGAGERVRVCCAGLLGSSPFFCFFRSLFYD